MSILWRRDTVRRCRKHPALAFSLSVDVGGRMQLHCHVPKASVAVALHAVAAELAADVAAGSTP